MRQRIEPRDALRQLADEKGVSFAALSRMVGRNVTYIQQFVTRGTPSHLHEEDRRRLSAFFGVDERVLGGSEPGPTGDLVQVARLAVEASAGVGSVVDGEDAIGRFGFDPEWLRRVCRARPADLSIIQVSGDSMSPTLVNGDDVLVDRSESGLRLRDGIYVLRRDDTLMVKRLALSPNAGTLTISSDNPAYPTWRDCPLDSVAVVGRAVWASRKLG